MRYLNIEIETATYYVSGLSGFSLSDALKCWKAKFETIKHFNRDVITHPCLEILGSFVAEMWDSIVPVSVQDALSEQNAERRRVMFDCIGVAKLFRELQPELLDRQAIQKYRTRWDKSNEPWEHEFEDIYELYKIEGNKLFEQVERWNTPNPVYAVRCWCTTTNREYWIYVPEDAAIGSSSWSERNNRKPDAIRAIAWTIRIDITNPKRIFRQGDIIVAEESADSKQVSPYHLTKEQYLKLIFSET